MLATWFPASSVWYKSSPLIFRGVPCGRHLIAWSRDLYNSKEIDLNAGVPPADCGRIVCELTQYASVIIDSDNGLVPFRHQSITWTKVDLLSTGSSRTNFNYFFLSKYKTFLLKICILKCCQQKWRPFRSGFTVLNGRIYLSLIPWDAHQLMLATTQNSGGRDSTNRSQNPVTEESFLENCILGKFQSWYSYCCISHFIVLKLFFVLNN